MELLPAVYLAAFSLLALAGAWTDLRTHVISNGLNLVILALGIVLVPLAFGWMALVWGLVHFAAALLVGIALFAIGAWGGGDAKFFAACAVWIPIQHTAAYLVGLGIAGLFLILGWLIWAKARGKPVSRKSPLPYGVAIAVGGIFAIVSLPALEIWPA